MVAKFVPVAGSEVHGPPLAASGFKIPGSKFKIQERWSRKKAEYSFFRHSRESGNPVFFITYENRINPAKVSGTFYDFIKNDRFVKSR